MKVIRQKRTALDPAAFVAEFANSAYWSEPVGPNGEPRLQVTLVEVFPGTTPSGRRRFVVEFVHADVR